MREIIKNNKLIRLFNGSDLFEEKTMNQLYNLSTLEWLEPIAVMPDAHWGLGATVGSVLASSEAVSPASVGVDIGCGMLAVPINKSIDQLGNLKKLRNKIEKAVPVGKGSHKDSQKEFSQLSNLPLVAKDIVNRSKAPKQIGTLGGGNHFIEICESKSGKAYIMLHSGSRGIGNMIAMHYIKKAKELMKIWDVKLVDPALSYFVKETPDFKNYLNDVDWCQKYAFINRQVMLNNILKVLDIKVNPKEVINCHHNYISLENHNNKNLYITRKGAIRARKDELGIIPSAMGQPSYIVKGLGNPDSYCSCSHGAGRNYSRTKARQIFTVEDLKKQTKGVECKKDKSVLDEIPSAYKDIKKVMQKQTDLVTVVDELKAVLCVKG